MAKGDRSVSPFRDDDDIRQDMYEDQERRYEEEMDRRDKVRKKTRKKLSDKEGLKDKKKARAAIRRAYAKDYGKFKSAFDHDFTNYKNDLAKEFEESERYNKTPEGKAELKKGRKEVRRNVAANRLEEKKRKARLRAAGSLFRAVSKGAGVLGVAGAVNEVRKAHKEIKKAGPGSFGSKTLLEILK